MSFIFKNENIVNTLAKCFKKCGFVDNTAENLAEELFGATTADELLEIDANKGEGDDDDDDDKIDFNVFVKKVVNHSIDEFTKSRKFTKDK